MAATWTITALSKKTTIPAATLRYWERLGVLPRAARTHTGYRLFAGEVFQYIEFVRKSKTMGLSLRQMKRVLEMARGGRSPCPEVEQWVVARLAKLEEQIRTLQVLERRLRVLSRGFGDSAMHTGDSVELCTLIVGLPEEKKFRERNGHDSTCFDMHCEKREENALNSKRTK